MTSFFVSNSNSKYFCPQKKTPAINIQVFHKKSSNLKKLFSSLEKTKFSSFYRMFFWRNKIQFLISKKIFFFVPISKFKIISQLIAGAKIIQNPFKIIKKSIFKLKNMCTHFYPNITTSQWTFANNTRNY